MELHREAVSAKEKIMEEISIDYVDIALRLALSLA